MVRHAAAIAHMSGSIGTEDRIDPGLTAWANQGGGSVAAAPAVAATATATAVNDHENNHHDSDCNKCCDHPSLG